MSNEITNIPTGGGMLKSSMSGSASVAIAQSREMAEAIAAIQMAKMFPRDMIQVREDVKNECMRENLAKCAVYTYSRKGATTPITGPSIRAAEVLARCMTNIDAAWRELEQTPESVKCQAFAWDKEKNVRHEITFTVSKFRHTQKGDYLLTDPRDIYEKCANEASRRKRACILAIIPGDLVDEAMEYCHKTLVAKADVSPEGIKKLLDAFKAYGVTKGDIEKRIQRKIESIQPSQVVDLRNVYNSLRDGMGVKEDYFKPDTINVQSETGPTVDSNSRKTAKNALKNALGLKDGQPSPEAIQTPQSADTTPSGEGVDAGGFPY